MSSQFDDLFKAVRDKKQPKTSKQGSPEIEQSPPQSERAAAQPSKELSKSDKRNLDFEQTLVYLRTTTKRQVKKSLLDDPDGRDFSDLVEELLVNWLRQID